MKNLKINEETIEQHRSFLKWTQEFSKKIVTITFIIFVLVNLFILSIILYSYLTSNELMYIDILMSETHQTFREVIGGYIIKAAAENAIKIAGSVVEKYIDYISNKYGYENTESEEYLEDNYSEEDSTY